MKIGSVDLAREVLIVAEIGNNHEGDIGLAGELIGLAAASGAQAVKFQSIRPGELVAPGQTTRLEQLGRFALSAEHHRTLAARAEREGVLFMSTPFFLDAVDFLDPLVPAFKIASGDNNFMPLLKRVAQTGKPILLSTGMAEISDIQTSVQAIEREWERAAGKPGLVLLHCVSAYPTPPEQANLRSIQELAKLGYTTGYSDHTLGTNACVIAVGLGARVLEKHFTISKTHSAYRDHQLSSDPDEFRSLVKRVRETEIVLGDGNKRIMPSEQPHAARRSIAAARSLPAGHRLTLADLAWLRPADGLAPGSEEVLLGAVLRRPVSAGEKLLLADVQRL